MRSAHNQSGRVNASPETFDTPVTLHSKLPKTDFRGLAESVKAAESTGRIRDDTDGASADLIHKLDLLSSENVERSGATSPVADNTPPPAQIPAGPADAPLNAEVDTSRAGLAPRSELVLEPVPPSRARSRWGLVGRLIVAAAIAAVVAFFLVQRPPLSRSIGASDPAARTPGTATPNPRGPSQQPPTVGARPAPTPTPERLATELKTAQRSTAQELTAGTPSRDTGTAAPSTTTAPSPVTPPAAAADNGPPDAKKAVSEAPRAGLASAAAPPAIPERVGRLDAPRIRPIDREEIALLSKRGKEFMLAGDIAAARLMLQRAAAAGDPDGALTLGATYDPAMLQKLNVHGIAADVATARMWYEKAKELGSPEASRALELLGQQGR